MPELTFKAALYKVVHRSELPAKALAELIGVSYSMLVNCANENLEDFNLRGDKIVPLTIYSQNNAILDYINIRAGQVAFKLPEPDPDRQSIVSHLSRAVSEFGDVLKTFDAALQEVGVSPQKVLAMENDTYELIQVLVNLLSAVETIAKSRG